MNMYVLYTRDPISRNLLRQCAYSGDTAVDAARKGVDGGSLSLKRGVLFAIDYVNTTIERLQLETDTTITPLESEGG